MSSDTISTKLSMEPIGSSGAQMVLQKCLNWDSTNGPFTIYISQSLGEVTLKGGDHGWGSSRQPNKSLRKAHNEGLYLQNSQWL